MENKNRIALITVLGGFLFSLLINLRIFWPTYNYTMTSIFGQFFGMMIRQLLAFILGGYVCSTIIWILSKKEKDFIPLILPLGAVLGGALGFAVSFPITSFIDKILGNIAGWLSAICSVIIVLAIPLIFAFFGTKLAMKINIKKPISLFTRLIVAVIGLVIILTPLILIYPHHNFPGKNQPMAVRHEWAVNRFGDLYEVTIEYLKGCEEIQREIGLIKEIAPTAGMNMVGSGPGELNGHFTLDVVGEEGSGIANLVVGYFGTKNTFLGKFTFNGKKIELPRQTLEVQNSNE